MGSWTPVRLPLRQPTGRAENFHRGYMPISAFLLLSSSCSRRDPQFSKGRIYENGEVDYNPNRRNMQKRHGNHQGTWRRIFCGTSSLTSDSEATVDTLSIPLRLPICWIRCDNSRAFPPHSPQPRTRRFPASQTMNGLLLQRQPEKQSIFLTGTTKSPMPGAYSH